MNKRNGFRKVMIVFLSIALLGAGTATMVMKEPPEKKTEMTKSGDWKMFSASDNRFRVRFPGEPKEEDRQTQVGKKTIHFKELSTEFKDSSYSVTYLDFPRTWKLLGSHTLLKKSFHKMLEKEAVKEIIYQKLMKFNGHPALDYAMKKGEKEIYGRLIVVGNTLYFLSVSSSKTKEAQINSKAFLDSFAAQKK